MTEKERFEIINEIKRELYSAKKVNVEICRDGITLPEYKHYGDAGMDIRAAIDIDIAPLESVIVPTGIKVEIPIGYELQIRPRSGLSLNTPLRLPNSIGTIDSGYRDEIGVLISNNSPLDSHGEFLISEKGNKFGTYKIKKGDRIAQIILAKCEKIEFNQVDDISKKDDRGGGFGHSGIK